MWGATVSLGLTSTLYSFLFVQERLFLVLRPNVINFFLGSQPQITYFGVVVSRTYIQELFPAMTQMRCFITNELVIPNLNDSNGCLYIIPESPGDQIQMRKAALARYFSSDCQFHFQHLSEKKHFFLNLRLHALNFGRFITSAKFL